MFSSTSRRFSVSIFNFKSGSFVFNFGVILVDTAGAVAEYEVTTLGGARGSRGSGGVVEGEDKNEASAVTC